MCIRDRQCSGDKGRGEMANTAPAQHSMMNHRPHATARAEACCLLAAQLRDGMYLGLLVAHLGYLVLTTMEEGLRHARGMMLDTIF